VDYSAGGLHGAASCRSDQDADADRDRKRQEWALLSLIGNALKGIIANPAAHPHGPAAEIGGSFGCCALAAPEAIGNIVEDRPDCIGNQIAGRGCTRRSAAAGLTSDPGQFSFDSAQVIDDCSEAGVGKSARTRLKHLNSSETEIRFG
jgi:hypothetical protein